MSRDQTKSSKESSDHRRKYRDHLRDLREKEASAPRTCKYCQAQFIVKPGVNGVRSARQIYCKEACRLGAYANERAPKVRSNEPQRYLTKTEDEHIRALIRKAGAAKLCRYLGVSAAPVTRAISPNKLLIRESLISTLMACTLEQAPQKVSSREAVARSKATMLRQDIYAIDNQVMQPSLLGRTGRRYPSDFFD